MIRLAITLIPMCIAMGGSECQGTVCVATKLYISATANANNHEAQNAIGYSYYTLQILFTNLLKVFYLCTCYYTPSQFIFIAHKKLIIITCIPFKSYS